MLLQLDFTSEVPIYRQVHDQLVLGIADGRLPAGGKLPTVRALANETGVNVMTINKAYQILKQEGYISTDRRGGTMVSGTNDSASADKLLPELRFHAAAAKLSGIGREDWLALCEQAYDANNDKEDKQK